MEKIKEILTKLGMSSYKIETYLSLLKIHSGTIQEIAKVSKVPSCKLYENLKWLNEKGFISQVIEKPLTYKANNPKIILKSEIHKKRDFLTDMEVELKKLNLPFLESDKDLVEVSKSKEAFINKLKESISNLQISISYLTKNWELDAELLRLLIKKQKQGVKIRALGPLDKKKTKLIKETKIKIRDYSPATTRFSVFDKKIVAIRLRKQEDNYYSIWIKSELLAEILENYFNMLWKLAKK